MQVQKAQRVPIKMNPKRPAPRNIIIKMPTFKYKERILKATREKQKVTYKGALISLAADLSRECSKPEENGKKIFQVMGTGGLQPRLLYPARLSIKIQGQIRSFQTKEV